MIMKNVVYTGDRVDVVRCGKCRLGKPYGKLIGCENENCGHSPTSLVDADWFCADGKRRDERDEAGERLEGDASASE